MPDAGVTTSTVLSNYTPRRAPAYGPSGAARGGYQSRSYPDVGRSALMAELRRVNGRASRVASGRHGLIGPIEELDLEMDHSEL